MIIEVTFIKFSSESSQTQHCIQNIKYKICLNKFQQFFYSVEKLTLK